MSDEQNADYAWEYNMVYGFRGRTDLAMQHLNRLGAQGWEAVTLQGDVALIKRRRPTQIDSSES